MKAKVVLCILVILFALPANAVQSRETNDPQLYYWLWWKNLENDWQGLIDFAAEQKMDGVVIWGLQGWKGDGQRCRKVVRYAHQRNVRVVHGLGLNGYEIGKHIVSEHPELAATIPAALADTKKGKWSRKAIFCPSKPKSMELLKQMLLRAADTGIDGFNFETADVDYITCHCPQCEKRFQNCNETENENKPVAWPLEHLKFAVEVLTESDPNLWLNCEFAMQRFGSPPYTNCERILRLNREIDPRMTVVWSEWWAPPDAIARRLCADRKNLGFYIRSGAIRGWDAKHTLSSAELLPIAGRLTKLKPVCIMYRAWQPLDRWAVNMGTAAKILQKPEMSEANMEKIVAKFQAMTKPGGPYSRKGRSKIAAGGEAE